MQFTAAEIQAKNGFGQLGFYLLGALYLCQTVGGAIGTAITQPLGVKYSMMLGTMLLSMQALATVLSAWKAE